MGYTEKRDKALKEKVTELAEQLKHYKVIRNQMKTNLLAMYDKYGGNEELFHEIRTLLDLCDEV